MKTAADAKRISDEVRPKVDDAELAPILFLVEAAARRGGITLASLDFSTRRLVEARGFKVEARGGNDMRGLDGPTVYVVSWKEAK